MDELKQKFKFCFLRNGALESPFYSASLPLLMAAAE